MFQKVWSGKDSLPQDANRAGRVRLVGTVLALVRLQNGRHVRARVHQLSANGGVLNLSDPLDEALPVQLLFHIGSTTVRSDARMMFPMWSTRGCLQPFRFTGLTEDARGRLENDLHSLLGIRPESPQLEDNLAVTEDVIDN